MSVRKPRAEDRSVQGIHEDLSTELTRQSRKKTMLEVSLKEVGDNPRSADPRPYNAPDGWKQKS